MTAWDRTDIEGLRCYACGHEFSGRRRQIDTRCPDCGSDSFTRRPAEHGATEPVSDLEVWVDGATDLEVVPDDAPRDRAESAPVARDEVGEVWVDSGDVPLPKPPLLPHLTPQPDGDVRTDLARLIRDVVEAGADWPFVADAVLASGHVVPVGEVERLRRWKAEALPVMDGLQELGRVLGVGLGRRITGPDGVKAAEALVAERDRAVAQVAAVRAWAESLDSEARDARDEAGGLPVGSREWGEWMGNAAKAEETAILIRDALGTALDTAPASPTTDQRIEARQLSGEHVGRVVVLPDGTRATVHATPSATWVTTKADGLRMVPASDVVTLIGGEERAPSDFDRQVAVVAESTYRAKQEARRRFGTGSSLIGGEE